MKQKNETKKERSKLAEEKRKLCKNALFFRLLLLLLLLSFHNKWKCLLVSHFRVRIRTHQTLISYRNGSFFVMIIFSFDVVVAVDVLSFRSFRSPLVNTIKQNKNRPKTIRQNIVHIKKPNCNRIIKKHRLRRQHTHTNTHTHTHKTPSK